MSKIINTSIFSRLINAAVTVTACVFLSAAAQADTIVYTITLPDDDSASDPFTLDANIVNGNCEDGACIGVPANGPGNPATITSTVPFSLTSFWFQLLGVALDNTLQVYIDGDLYAEYAGSSYGTNDDGQTISGDPLLAMNITSITFTNINSGNIRIDSLEVSYEVEVSCDEPGTCPKPPPSCEDCNGGSHTVPEPGTLALLGLGLAGMGAMRRRKKT